MFLFLRFIVILHLLHLSLSPRSVILRRHIWKCSCHHSEAVLDYLPISCADAESARVHPVLPDSQSSSTESRGLRSSHVVLY